MEHILQTQIDGDGVAIITLNQTNESTNLFSYELIRAYVSKATELLQNPDVKGIVVTSGKKEFVAGADLRMLLNPPADRAQVLNDLLEMHRGFRALEKGGKPIVAAINGTALGGGYELTLACHYRIALNNPKIRIGLPEVQLGLFPGGGGTQRLTRLIGIAPALTNILQAKQFEPKEAKANGYVDALADTPEDLVQQAKTYILNKGKCVQPWDDTSYRIPGGGLMSKNGFQNMTGGIGNLQKKTHGHYKGAQYAMASIHDGLELPIDRALEVEARYFVAAMYLPEAHNLIRTGFFALNEAKKGKAKPEGYAPYAVQKLGVLGAGMMGAGIAYVSMRAGMQVVLKDVTVDAAEKGKAYSTKLLQERVQRGKMTQAEMDAALSLIQTTDNPADLAGCDLVIEAVFENPDLKAKVTQETESVLNADKIYASNTSTIPITLLAKAAQRPKNFIGIHFFSPVDKMPLVEIIVGKETSDYAIAAAIDYVTAIDKVPIVVNDSRGFFTSRVFGVYTGEGALLLEEGTPAAVIENVAKQIGMPVGPLAVTDEVALTLALHVMDASGEPLSPTVQRVYNVYAKLARELGREGKKAKKGFYDYPDGEKKRLWSGLKELYPPAAEPLDAEVVGKRLLHLMALESYRCYEEGVLRSSRDGDIGSLLGLGFPPYTGGVFSYIDYVGIQAFVRDCDDFAARFGERFVVPASLRKMAEEGRTFN